MQAPAWTRRLEPGQIKLVLIAAAATGILLLGAVLSTSVMNGDQAPTVDRAESLIARPTPNDRFLGWNILPGDPGTYPATSQQEYRFRDWNILPGDDVQFVPPAYERGTRY